MAVSAVRIKIYPNISKIIPLARGWVCDGSELPSPRMWSPECGATWDIDCQIC